jgi:hypothetical protein
MARRIANPFWFRAEAARIPWAQIAQAHLKHASSVHAQIDPELAGRLKRMRETHPADVHLRWACAKELGVPTQPFMVWRRRPSDRPEPSDFVSHQLKGGLAIRWGQLAAYVEVRCQPINPSRAVGLFVTRSGAGLRQTVGAAAQVGAAGGTVRLVVRCSGATQAVLVNGHSPVLRIELLQKVIEGDWETCERVGLPVDDPWPGTSYDTGPQGLVDALADPVPAALERLERGGPPLGWFPGTSTGRTAPPWVPPDYTTLLKEIRSETIPRIQRIYRPALPPHDQHLVVDESPVDGPEGSDLPATAKLPPLSLLVLPAASDPFLALALGFGTAYPEELNTDIPVPDFLVTAEYEEVPDRTGPAEVAAYLPVAPVHSTLAQPLAVAAARGGLVAPAAPDLPWRESIRVSWNLTPPAAALGRGSGAALARVTLPTDTAAECLLPLRAAGDFRPLLPVPDGPPDTPGHSRTGMVDALAEIPIGSGGRQPLYPVAWQDVFGVWSRWVDAQYVGTEPAVSKPRIIALGLDAQFTGSTLCPASLNVELAVDWAERTPTGVRVHAGYFPMTASNDPVPAFDPESGTPAGGFRRDTMLAFDAGGELSGGPDVVVAHLDGSGDNEVAPGTAQGTESRRYKVVIPVPALDFAATGRWGVAVWVRTELRIGGTSDLAPSPTSPALTSAASPVPIPPIPPPLPPGVPMGSVEDAQGCSHARVRWSIPSGADLEPTRGIVVWEVAETALRQTVGLPPRAPEGTLPGVRLQQLWNAYDAMTPDGRRAAFRRQAVLPGAARETDVVLPKGSTDIHLFTVTTLSRAGVESPWPAPAGAPHEALQAVIAPRLRQPAAPLLRSVISPTGVALSLSSASRIPVREFRMFRTRSAAAARTFESMGPPFAVAPANAPPVGTPVDPFTGELTYTAELAAPFDPSWDDWYVRAVAVPVDVRAVEAERGVVSPACEPVIVTVTPSGPPVLSPLVATRVGTGELILVTTSTTAPMRAVALGRHLLSADVAGDAAVVGLAPTALEAVPDGPVTAADPPPTGADPGVVAVHGPRAAGSSPLALWLTRADATVPVDVTVRLLDPAGRLTEQVITVPAGGEAPPPDLTLIESFRIAGRGLVVIVSSGAPVPHEPPYVLQVTARPVVGPFPPLPPPIRARFPLNDIPERIGPFIGSDPILVMRDPATDPATYSLLIRSTRRVQVTLTLVAPDGTRAQVVVGPQ